MRTTRRWTAIAAVVAALQLPGCGYLIFPERTGQPSGQVDWAVVGLDAIGLLFGVIPGVVAFAVDLATGCIYLPPEPFAAAPSSGANKAPLAGWRPVGFTGTAPGAVPSAEEVVALLKARGHAAAWVDADHLRWRPSTVLAPGTDLARRG